MSMIVSWSDMQIPTSQNYSAGDGCGTSCPPRLTPRPRIARRTLFQPYRP